MTPTLIANGSVDAQVTTLRIFFLALVNSTLQFVREVPTVILPVADEVKADADLVLTEELVLAATSGQLCSSNVVEKRVAHSSVFVLAIRTVPPSIAERAKRHTSRAARTSHEVCWTNLVLAHTWLVAVILTVIVSVAEKVVQDASVVGAFEFIFLADIVADCCVFV